MAPLDILIFRKYVFDTSSEVLHNFCFFVLMTTLCFFKIYISVQLQNVFSLFQPLKFVTTNWKVCMLLTLEDLGACVKDY